jgi:hypothetical protein
MALVKGEDVRDVAEAVRYLGDCVLVVAKALVDPESMKDTSKDVPAKPKRPSLSKERMTLKQESFLKGQHLDTTGLTRTKAGRAIEWISLACLGGIPKHLKELPVKDWQIYD